MRVQGMLCSRAGNGGGEDEGNLDGCVDQEM